MNEKMVLAKRMGSNVLVGLLVGVGMALAVRGEQVATLDTADGKVHVRILPDAEGAHPPAFSVPFLTVTAEAAEALDGVFVVDKPADKMVGTVSVRANADGTKTFVANVVTGGLTIIFR